MLKRLASRLLGKKKKVAEKDQKSSPKKAPEKDAKKSPEAPKRSTSSKKRSEHPAKTRRPEKNRSPERTRRPEKKSDQPEKTHSPEKTRSPEKKSEHPEKKPKLELKPVEGVFKDLIPEIQKAIAEKGYVTPTPIQAESIPHLIEGRDILGCAQTGTGKTAAFALPILQYLKVNNIEPIPGGPRALVVSPTRELAHQIAESFKNYGRYTGVRHTVIYGGVSQVPQANALEKGVHIVVATPGRLLDLMSQGLLSLKNVDFFVMDEADRMMDMGFLPDLRKIVRALPKKRQSLLFSATLPDAILSLANTLVNDPVSITIAADTAVVDKIAQKMFFVDKSAKFPLLMQVLAGEGKDKVIVFAQMKHIVSRIADELCRNGVKAEAIHGDKSQIQRAQALENFKNDRSRVLVATDVAARGLDIDDVSHVINFDLPMEAETYVHRIGRTARAGKGGDAVSFCGRDEKEALRNIELLLGKDFSENGANASAQASKDPNLQAKAKISAKRFKRR
jgi:ATP-dependent RNA helicase RhlE